MMLCKRCVWANKHIDRGRLVRVVCPFLRCVVRYGWAAKEDKKHEV